MPVTIHGESKAPLYKTWSGMKYRCQNPNHPAYYLYGKRGITVCVEWGGPHSYWVFRRWALDTGYHRGLSIDRIDSNGPYAPWNCRWVSNLENCNNLRKTIRFRAFGETKTLGYWFRDPRCAVKRNVLDFRIRNGWNPELAISVPTQSRAARYQDIATIQIIRRMILAPVSL